MEQLITSNTLSCILSLTKKINSKDWNDDWKVLVQIYSSFSDSWRHTKTEDVYTANVNLSPSHPVTHKSLQSKQSPELSIFRFLLLKSSGCPEAFRLPRSYISKVVTLKNFAQNPFRFLSYAVYVGCIPEYLYIRTEKL